MSAPAPAHLNLQQPVEGDGAGEHRTAGADVVVHRLARNRGLIDRGAAFEHGAVHGDPLAGTHENLVAWLEAVWIDALLDAVVPPHRLPGGERANPVDGRARAERAALLEQTADLEEERNQRRGHEVAGRGRREHRDRDQLIGGPARVAGHDAAQAGDERGNRHDCRGQRPAQLADLPLIGRQTHQKRAEAEQPDARESGAEPHADPAAFFRRQRAGHGVGIGRQDRECEVAHRGSPSAPTPAEGRRPTAGDRDAESAVLAAGRRRKPPDRAGHPDGLLDRIAVEALADDRGVRAILAIEREKRCRVAASDGQIAFRGALRLLQGGVGDGLRLRNHGLSERLRLLALRLGADVGALHGVEFVGERVRRRQTRELERRELEARMTGVEARLRAARRRGDEVLAAVGEHAIDAHLAQRTHHRGRHLDPQHVVRRRARKTPTRPRRARDSEPRPPPARCSGRRSAHTLA